MDSNSTEEEMTAYTELNREVRQADRQLDVHSIKANFAFRRNRRAAVSKRDVFALLFLCEICSRTIRMCSLCGQVRRVRAPDFVCCIPVALVPQLS